MAGVRLRGEIKSQAGIDWQIDIYDELYVGPIVEIEDAGFNFKIDKQGDDILEVIKAQSGVLQAFNADDYGVAFDSFVTDFIGADENRFKMRVFKNAGFYWGGNVIVDQSGFENMPKPRIFTIIANDFGRLTNIPFVEAIPVTGPQSDTIITHLNNVLEYLDMSQFYAAGDTYIQESFEFTENQVGAIGATESMFIKTRYSSSLNIKNLKDIDLRDTTRVRTAGTHVDNRKYIEIQDTDEPMSAKQVLVNIMRIMMCRIHHSNGMYIIQQVRNFDSATYEARNIKKDGTVASASTITHEQTLGVPSAALTLDVLAFGRFQYIVPLNKAIVTTPNTFTANILKPGQLNVNSGTTTDTFTIQLGSITGGNKKKISVTWENYLVKLTTSGLNSLITLTFKFIFGSNRLLGANNSNITKWTTTAADVVTRTVLYPAVGADGLRETDGITSADIPSGTHVNCTLVVTASIAAISGTLPTASNIDYILQNLFISLQDGERFISGSTYEVDNPSSNDNSIVLDFGTLTLADEGILSTLNAFEVNTTGSTFVISDTWDAGFGTDTSLAQTIPQEAMSLQRTPIEMVQGPLRGDWSPAKTLDYNSNTYVFNGGTHNLRDDEIRGEWFELITSKTSVQIDKKIDKEEKYNGRTPTSSRIRKKYWEWIDIYKDFDSTMSKVRTFVSSGGAVTSIDIDDPGNSLMKKGDKVQLINVMDGTLIDEVTLTADVDSGDTTMSITSITLSEDTGVGSKFRHNPRELVTSQKGRFETLQQIQAPFIKVTVADTATFNLEKDMVHISSQRSLTGTQTITLPALSECWNADLGIGARFTIKDADTNASVNNITIDLDDSSTEDIIYTNGAENTLVIGIDGLDITLQVTSATTVEAY